MGADIVLDPADGQRRARILEATGGNGVDVLLEMSGHPAAIRQGFRILRMGGRASLLGIPSRDVEIDLANDVIFKGATVHGINGRKMYETWYQMEALLRAASSISPRSSRHRLPLRDFDEGDAPARRPAKPARLS